MYQNKDYKLTIIVSNYNQELFLQNAIKSIFEQKTSIPYQIIIVDDYSTKDNSRSLIRELGEKYNNIYTILAETNKGYLVNVMRAKEITKTDYFCLLDADDYWTDKNYIQRAYDFLESHKDYSIYECNVAISDDNNPGVIKNFLSEKYKPGTYTKMDFVSGNRIPITQTTGMFFRNDIFKYGIPDVMKQSVGTPSARSFEGDKDRFVMHLSKGKAFYCGDIVGVYRYTNTGIWSRLSKFEQRLLNARALVDYYSYYESDLEFFASKSWEILTNSMIKELKDFLKMSVEPFDSIEEALQNINYVYCFCVEHKDDIVIKKENPIKTLIHFVLRGISLH